MKHVSISNRKADHLNLTSDGQSTFRNKTTLLQELHLIHQALPECSLDDIKLHCELFGHSVSAPMIIAGMTGGHEKAVQINQDLAKVAQALNIPFGLGSQRAMALHPELIDTFDVRKHAPDVLLIGNIGVVHAKEYGTAHVHELTKKIQANVMAIHLNPAMELIQEQGDRDFTGCLDTIKSLLDTLDIPIVVKETGCGISPQVAKQLKTIGVQHIDVSGSGGTSWVAVESRRAQENSLHQSIGEELWDWGLPTAVSIASCVHQDMNVIASGGIRTASDIAAALSLGAQGVGFAAPVLTAYNKGGYDQVLAFFEKHYLTLKSIMLLTGSQDIHALQNAPHYIDHTLREWLTCLGLR